jgi:hypothetical protein
MKSIMLAGAALLAFGAGASGIALAQGGTGSVGQPPATDTMPPGEPAVPATPATPATPGGMGESATPATPATPADPNAGQPTGAVPRRQYDPAASWR